MKGNSYVPFMLRRGDGSTLSLDFTAMGGTLDSRFTFTRSSTTSTYINSSGYVATAGTNVARFDYDPTTLTARGLLIEGTATNLAKYSDTLNQVSGVSLWYGSNFNTPTIASGVSDPANGANTWKAVAASGAGYHCWRQTTTFTAASYTFSIWAKAAEYDRIVISDLGSGRGACTFVLSGNGTQTPITGGGGTPTATITAYPNGWYRCSITMTMTAANYGIAIGGYPSSGATVNEFGASYTADGTSGVYLWGYQAELGSGASSYIPTGASTVQRAADTCIAASTGFSSWFTGGTSGTFYADWYGGVRGITSTVRTVLSTSDVTARHLHLQQTAAAGNLKVADFGAANVVTTSNSITSGARTKGAFSFSGGTVNLTLNGGTVATSSSLAFSTAPTWLVLGGTSTDGSTITDATVLLNGSIRVIKYWPSVLPTATLQSLTA